ncbi:hypothetical protein NE848_14755 [Gramella jeungdoensis]|uniref:NYN domain-containing protein n=1 Tax=Gramella jeungdoensis TaxID=708091 RepID=A0ABT0Z4J8_9FLAO|nr:hypothetical protein [Gramella jeungdoensis]MCM8570653.1 hypothetical protein [Gramella jeungdoensis]
MISGKLKSYFFSKKIRHALSEKSRPFNDFSGKAGLIIDAENLDEKWNLADFYRLVPLKKEDYSIAVCGSRESLPEDLDVPVLDPKEISVKGEFKSEAIRSFAEEGFDFLICHLSDKSTASVLLSAVTKAGVKIGNKPDEYGIYDVEIDSGDIEVFQQEALKYLKILKKNN